MRANDPEGTLNKQQLEFVVRKMLIKLNNWKEHFSLMSLVEKFLPPEFKITWEEIQKFESNYRNFVRGAINERSDELWKWSGSWLTALTTIRIKRSFLGLKMLPLGSWEVWFHCGSGIYYLSTDTVW